MDGPPPSRATILAGALFLVVGLLIGWQIGRDRAWDEAGEWAVRTAHACEKRPTAGSVADCLGRTIADAEAARQDERRGEREDPRR